MITVLTVEDCRPKHWYEHILSLFLPQSIDCRFVEKMSVQVLYINVKRRKGKLPWRRISKIAGSNKCKILCDESISIPSKYGIKRFNDKGLSYKLCRNALFFSLRESNVNPTQLKISIYDPDGMHPDIVQYFLPFTSQLKVVTNKAQLYKEELDRLMNEHGASVFLSNNIQCLYPCNVIIALDRIATPLGSKRNTVIFTTDKPAVPIKGIIYHNYEISHNNVYNSLKPRLMNQEYFLSALYKEYLMYEFEEIKPYRCKSMNNWYTIEDICKVIIEQM